MSRAQQIRKWLAEKTRGGTSPQTCATAWRLLRQTTAQSMPEASATW